MAVSGIFEKHFFGKEVFILWSKKNNRKNIQLVGINWQVVKFSSHVLRALLQSEKRMIHEIISIIVHKRFRLLSLYKLDDIEKVSIRKA